MSLSKTDSLQVEKFKFNHVLPENVPQSEVFSRVLSPYLELFYDGYDLFVIMYGGSGSGKTHTLFGPETIGS